MAEIRRFLLALVVRPRVFRLDGPAHFAYKTASFRPAPLVGAACFSPLL
jgi:hypothetical protein